jgi:hypothetical protein
MTVAGRLQEENVAVVQAGYAVRRAVGGNATVAERSERKANPASDADISALIAAAAALHVTTLRVFSSTSLGGSFRRAAHQLMTNTNNAPWALRWCVDFDEGALRPAIFRSHPDRERARVVLRAALGSSSG